jgi:plastocyanin
MKKVAIIIVTLAIVGGGVFAISRSGNDKNTANTTSNSTSIKSTTSSSTTNTTPSQTTADNTITYTDNGFTPSTLTVKAGSKVTIKNTSSGTLQFDSDPHPQHTDDPEINVGIINSGESQTVTVTKTGTHGYHNHLNPGDRGTLVVD